MPVPIEREEQPELPYEPCCFCDMPTPFWTAMRKREPGEQVACCTKCAPHHNQRDVPSKEKWCRAVDDYSEAFLNRIALI